MFEFDALGNRFPVEEIVGINSIKRFTSQEIICKIFHIKACQCHDEPLVLKEESTEPEESGVKHCNTHVRFKMSCPQCQDAVRA